MTKGIGCMEIFGEQMERIKLITGKRTQAVLADLLDVRQSFVSDAKRRGKIPSNWLVMLTRYKHANPEWILTGKGPMFVSFPSSPPRYETAGEAAAAGLTKKPYGVFLPKCWRRNCSGA